jgi:hypothetical protein
MRTVSFPVFGGAVPGACGIRRPFPGSFTSGGAAVTDPGEGRADEAPPAPCFAGDTGAPDGPGAPEGAAWGAAAVPAPAEEAPPGVPVAAAPPGVPVAAVPAAGVPGAAVAGAAPAAGAAPFAVAVPAGAPVAAVPAAGVPGAAVAGAAPAAGGDAAAGEVPILRMSPATMKETLGAVMLER